MKCLKTRNHDLFEHDLRAARDHTAARTSLVRELAMNLHSTTPAERVGSSSDTIRRRIACGHLRATKHTHAVRITEAEIQRFLCTARAWR
jgi:hypothetical protein